MRAKRDMAALGLVSLAAFATASVRPRTALGQEKGIGAVGSFSDPHRLEDAIGESDRERHDEVVKGTGPFKPSGVFLPPLYVANAEHSIEWLGLLYFQLTDFDRGTRTRALPPLFMSFATPESRTLVTPLFGEREDEDGRAGYALNYTYRRDRLQDNDIVFPFYWSFRERDMEDGPDARSSGALAPFAFWHSEASGRHWAFAPPLFWRWGDANETSTLLGPVFWHDEPGESSISAFPFYFSRTEGAESTAFAIPPLYIHSEDGVSSKTFLLNTFYSSTPEGHSLVSFPFVWSFANQESSTLVAPPLLLLHSSDKDGSRLISFPLLWHLSDKEGSTTLFLPLWLSGSNSAEGTSFDVGLPLLWHFQGPQSERLALFPFFDYASDPTRRRLVAPILYHGEDFLEKTSSTVVLGLYWDVKGTETHANVIFPFWWDFERPGSQSELRTAFPVYWRYDHAGESTSVLLNTAWTTSANDGNAWSFHVFPLFDVGSDRPDHFRWQVLGGLFGRETAGDLHRWRLAWNWTDASN
jgi:hypothetical protein